METLFETFKARAEAVSAEVHRFATRQGAFGFILGLLKEQGVLEGPRAAPCGPRQLPGRRRPEAWERGPRAQLPGDPRGRGGGPGRHQPGGLGASPPPAPWWWTPPRWSSGWSPPCRPSTWPWLGTGRILPDLAAAVLHRIRPGQTGYLSFITGPSRTADIERVLTIGVHGPERLIIVFVDEFEGGNA